nr:adenylate/guanylate cyclase domain-containing protein [Planctomycetota bacterium]
LIRGGTVDKYVGDAIMAFWGAPSRVEEHALRACEAAWDSQQALRVLRFRWEHEGLPPFRARIGVNTGRMLVGNIGSTDRMNYTVMGDAVNLGSRLEGICKMYGIEIALGDATYQAASKDFLARPVDFVEVKGRSAAVVFHELLGPRGDIEPDVQRFADLTTEAFERYLAREFAAAHAAFERALELRPDDIGTKILTTRCASYMRKPPPEDWTGAVRLMGK